MPLGVDNFVQENTGTTTAGTSHVVTVPSGTTAGNTVVVAFHAGGAQPTLSGFTLAKSQGSSTWVLYKADVPAAESSWTFTTVSSIATAWYVAEVSNVDLVDVVDATQGATSGAAVGNGGTASTGTTALNAGLYSMALAVFGFLKGSGSDTVSWSGYTNGFEEVADLSPASPVLAVARLFESGTTRTFELTATLATNGTAQLVHAVMVVFRAADSPVVAPLAMLAGFEPGTHGGVTASSGDSSMLGAGVSGATGTFGTSYLIQAGSARNSGYGLRIVQSAAATYVRMANLGSKSAALGLNVRVVSATGTVVVAQVADQIASSIYAQILYDASASQFGVRVGTTGTTQWQSGTTPANTWVWIDLRERINTTTWQVDWRIETGADTYTDQTPATLGGQSATAGTLYSLIFGVGTAQTMTADFDDVVISRYFGAYPLGPHEVKLLTVDPAGTPSVSGTSANFKVFTANGTLATWDPTAARNALDEVPPTISAAADGVAQVTAAASDYMEFPMATYTLGPTEFVNGVRMLAPLWSGTGAGAGDLAIHGWDGTTETALATASQITPGAPTAVSSTAPVWRCAMWQSPNGWTQAELDAAALRVGFSGDATPDMGVEAIYLEVAVGKTKTQPLFGTMASAEVDPTRLGAVSVTMAAPDAGGDSSLYYEESGSPTTVPVTGGTTTTQQINATFEPDTNYIAAYWPPEGVPDA